MYIKQVFDANMGPISSMNISPSFTDEGNPKPLIIVGENGSGKSTFISNIVDSFYELAGTGFDDALHKSNNGNGNEYYKIMSGLQIQIGKQYLFSRIVFDNEIEYIFVSGNCSIERFKADSGYTGNIPDWNEKPNKKHIDGANLQKVEELFSKNVFCYFGPERYEKPNWIGETYYEDLDTHLNIEQRFTRRLKNPISPCNMGKSNLRWLLDLIVDSRADIERDGSSLKCAHVNMNNLMAMIVARKNVERVMSEILCEDIYFGLNLRRDGGARFNIQRREDSSVIAPTLDSLSTGQLALFNIFSTIIRYADNNDINKSIHLDQISGIVVIDEIELHLHAIHQKEILPRLIKLFPKVQFIITTHSPLFLLGMRDEYGENGIDIYQMPDGIRIDTECFSEFSKAYSYFESTETHHERIIAAIDDTVTDNPIVITEGATDWKHLLAAYNNLKNRPEYKELFDDIQLDFFKYEPANSSKPAKHKINMGNSALLAMCESYSKMPQKRKMIYIADCDNEGINKKIGVPGANYKCWGNNVYSFILPVPDSRKDTPSICIEHLYSDKDIKTEYIENNIPRRLYLGNEFNANGVSMKLNKLCTKPNKCGPGKIGIIDGTSDQRVIMLDSDDETNFALSKMKFAECVLEKKPGFENFDFSNFISIFKIINEILKS